MMMMYTVNTYNSYLSTCKKCHKYTTKVIDFRFVVSIANCTFQGTSTEQDTRFSDKEKKLMKQMKFGDCLTQQV